MICSTKTGADAEMMTACKLPLLLWAYEQCAGVSGKLRKPAVSNLLA